MYNFLWKDSHQGTRATAEDLEAIAKCLRLGARNQSPTAKDLALKSFTTVDSDTSITVSEKVMLRQKSSFIVLFSDGRCEGHVSLQEVQEGIQHGLGEEPVLVLSHSTPLFLAASTPLQELRHSLSMSSCNIAIIIEADQIIGYTDAQSLLCRTISKRRLPPSWIDGFGEMRSLIEQIGEVAESLGFQVYIIGGWVRDHLLNKESPDIDCSVEGEAITLGHALGKRFGGTVISNALFGASHWTTDNGIRFDFTSTRTEVYMHPGALPATSPSNLLADFRRRDFTINMMAICINPSRLGELIDPYGGERDLKRKELRVVHGLSFIDDPTRILRGARYLARYDLQLHLGTETLLLNALQITKVGTDISLERIGNEFQRIFSENQPHRCWGYFRDWELFSHWIPEIRLEITSQLELVSAFYQDLLLDDPDILHQACWNMLAYAVPEESRSRYAKLAANRSKGQKHWRSNPLRISLLLDSLEKVDDKGQIGKSLEESTADQWLTTLAINPSLKETVYWWVEHGRHIKCGLNGKQLIALGCPRGPKIGKALTAAKKEAWRGGDQEEQRSAAKALWS